MSNAEASQSGPRVVFVDHSARMGGAEHYLLDVVRRLDLPSRVVLFEDGPFADALGAAGASVSVLNAPAAIQTVKKEAGSLSALASAPSLVGFVRRLSQAFAPDDVVYLNSQKALVAGAPAAAMAGKPAIWNLHDILTAEHFGTMNRRAAVFVANRFVSRVVVNSLATRVALQKSGFRGSTVDTVYNGIDDRTFEPIPLDARRTARRDAGLPHGVIVGLFGRVARWKGQHVLIQALTELAGVTALIVGGPLFQDDEDYLEEITALASSLDVTERVMFAGSRPDVAALMPLCDVIVHTSVAPEPFGRVIVEAMFCGVPVIVSSAGGAREIVGDNEYGLLVEPGNPNALVAAIRQVLASPIEASFRAQQALAAARSRYSMDGMVTGVRHAITSALEQEASA